MGRSQNDKDSAAHHHENKLTTKIGAGMDGKRVTAMGHSINSTVK
jgi:hypothetical protein